jgi:maleylpyruvate isomerase
MGGVPVTGNEITDDEIAALVATVDAATDRLLGDLGRVDDAVVEQPSRLPGWNRAMVLTHIARNADAFRGLLDGALRGDIVHMYPHGRKGRTADIEAGRQRPAAVVVEDVEAAARRFQETCTRMTYEAWLRPGEVFAGQIPAWSALVSRRREVEVHHVDLGLWYEPDDWPASFVIEELNTAVAHLPARLPGGTALRLVASDEMGEWSARAGPGPEAEVRAPAAQLLAWLLGRPSTVTDGPELAAWQ